MLNALMLVFVMTAAGEGAQVAIRFPSMRACEDGKPALLAKLSQDPRAKYIAVACVVPAKVKSA